MITRRILDIDTERRITTWHEHDPVLGKTRIIYEQDVEPIIEANKTRQLNQGKAMDTGGDWWHAAHIPDAVWMKWRIEEGIDIFNRDHMPAVKRKLDDPDYRHLRTGVFRLGKTDQ